MPAAKLRDHRMFLLELYREYAGLYAETDLEKSAGRGQVPVQITPRDVAIELMPLKAGRCSARGGR